MSEDKKKNYRRRGDSESGPDGEDDGPANNKVAKLDNSESAVEGEKKKRDEEEEELDYEHDDEDQEEEETTTESRRSVKCQCSTVERQEREIQALKRQLLQKNVYEGNNSKGRLYFWTIF